ncbi:MAG: TrkA family potassium uptake protein [Turicibacter sp.]|nr:TrkA family potassium uptake protein [Turicibacter sp.]
MKFKQRAKSVLIIGMGRFGRHLATKLVELDNEVMIVDKQEIMVRELAEIIEDVFIGDCTNENVVKSLGVRNFDICFVTIGDNFESSLIITTLLKKFGASHVITKTSREIQSDILKRIGADEVIYPERVLAEKMAVRITKPNIVDYIELTPEYVIFEIGIPAYWVGRTIADIDVRRKYQISILCIKRHEVVNPLPMADYEFQGGEQIVVSGRISDIERLMNTDTR